MHVLYEITVTPRFAKWNGKQKFTSWAWPYNCLTKWNWVLWFPAQNEKQRFTYQESCQYYTPKMHTVQTDMPPERTRTPSKATKTRQAPIPSEKVVHTSSASCPQFWVLYKTNNLWTTFWSWKQKFSKYRVSRGLALHYIKQTQPSAKLKTKVQIVTNGQIILSFCVQGETNGVFSI